MFGRLSCPNHFQGIKNNQSLGKRAIDYLKISINTVDSRNIYEVALERVGPKIILINYFHR